MRILSASSRPQRDGSRRTLIFIKSRTGNVLRLVTMPTVAKGYYYPIMQKSMTRYWYLSPAYAGKPVGLLPATVAADLRPCRAEIYHLTKRVIDALKGALTVEISITSFRRLVNCSKP
jgi:hypothetical protein